MRPYPCPTGDQTVFFDDLGCVGCGTPLGFLVSSRSIVAVDDHRVCGNRAEIGCSFLVEDDHPQCRSCRTTTVRPPGGDIAATAEWARAEASKRHLFVQCLGLGWDIEGASFEFPSSAIEPVVTGHVDGVITIDVHEASDVARTRMAERLGEQYRTVLGHLRHEYGHYLWWRMVDGTDRLAPFRERFGDERADYQQALDQHYASDPDPGWNDRHVSEYASAHPWEDFAETVAHYLHVTDTLETASAFGLEVDGDAPPVTPARRSMSELIDAWLPLAQTLNALNRSMGHADAYPFVLAPAVIEKLGWVHGLTAPDDGESQSGDGRPLRRELATTASDASSGRSWFRRRRR